MWLRCLCKGIVAAALVAGHSGCVSPRVGDHRPDLDLAPQSSRRYQCGPTTLASVLAFHGVEVAEEEISDALYSPTARGVLLTDLARFAREHGFETEIRTGELSDLLEEVEGRRPPIVLLDLGVGGVRVPHFTAVTGGTEKGVFQLGDSPSDEFEYVSVPLMERQWKRAGNQYLVVSPQSVSSP